MDVLTEQEVRVRAGITASPWPLYGAALLYAVVVGIAIGRHEAWVDEAQSWLLARDANLVELWTRLLHYEGTTGLWQTLLHGLIRAGMPYGGMNALSGLLGFAAACVLLWRAPFPLALRIALPFTFFLGYQYAVIARSYDLLPLLLFCCAAIYYKATETPLLFTAILCLMAAVSIHGMVLALAAGLPGLVSCRDRKRFAVPVLCFIVVIVLLALAARPAPDGTFIPGLNYSFDHLIQVSQKAFATAFTGDWVTSLLVVALSVPLLWRGGAWWSFALACGLLCGVASAVYSQVWHHGVLFLAWLFALWISADRPAIRNGLSYKLGMASLAIVVAVQCYWTVRSIEYDWNHAYSGSREAAQGLRELNLAGKKLYAIGFACIAIEPYFAHNIFTNVNQGRPQAYWDWSRRNHVNEDSLELTKSRPDYVIVGYKNEFERGVWTHLVGHSGYQVIRHFEGNTFWQTGVLEPESYDLFARESAP